jgi:stage IV sporulation protein B
MAGIGTMTFYDPESGMFAALGHGINDVDTSMLMPMDSGGIMSATVSDVKKGTSGQPGELHGQFDMTRDMGSLYANTERGVFGRLTDGGVYGAGEEMEVARPEEVKVGPATILSNVQGDEVKEYRIKITHVDRNSKDTRNLMIQVVDPELMNRTGGIVQGMSGSPILQNGKLVGAVTHVLVNDPTRGYGIFIETMLDAAS